MNLFELPEQLPEDELFEKLIPDHGVLIERIISTGQSSPEGFWCDQPRDEWVVLLQGKAKLAWEDGTLLEMKPGDWLLIPAGKRHRIEWTSKNPPCLWLAVHGPIQAKGLKTHDNKNNEANFEIKSI